MTRAQDSVRFKETVEVQEIVGVQKIGVQKIKWARRAAVSCARADSGQDFSPAAAGPSQLSH